MKKTIEIVIPETFEIEFESYLKELTNFVNDAIKEKFNLFSASVFIKKVIYGNISFKDENHPNSIFYKKDDAIIFEFDMKEKTCFVEYKNIWATLYEKLELTYAQTQQMISDIKIFPLNRYDIKPCPVNRYIYWEKILNNCK